MTFSDGAWKLLRDSPDFSPLDFWQRFTGEFSADGAIISGRWETSRNGPSWEHDFDLQQARLGSIDEPTGAEIQRGNEYRVGPIGADGIDATTLELAEELCQRFKLGIGLTKLEISFLDDSYQFAWRHERVQLARLAEGLRAVASPAS